MTVFLTKNPTRMSAGGVFQLYNRPTGRNRKTVMRKQNNIERYQWENALIDAQLAGLIGNGELLTALKLSRNINWKPKDGRAPGLYWKNDDAFFASGLGRATFYRHRTELFNAGFLALVGGNLLPTLPNERVLEQVEKFRESILDNLKVRL